MLTHMLFELIVHETNTRMPHFHRDYYDRYDDVIRFPSPFLNWRSLLRRNRAT